LARPARSIDAAALDAADDNCCTRQSGCGGRRHHFKQPSPAHVGFSFFMIFEEIMKIIFMD